MVRFSRNLTGLLLGLFALGVVRTVPWVGLSLLVVTCGPARKVPEPGLAVKFEPPATAVLGGNDLALAFDNPSWRQRVLVIQLRLETPSGKELQYRKQIEVPGYSNQQLKLGYEAAELGLHRAYLRCYELERGELTDSAVDWGIVVRPLWEFTHDRSYYTDEAHLYFRSRLNRALPAGAWLEVALCQERTVLAHQRIEIKGMRSAGEFDISSFPRGSYAVKARLLNGDALVDSTAVPIAKLPPGRHEVKIDLFTKGLLVDSQPFFPIGLYWLQEEVLGPVKKIHFNSGDYFYRLSGGEISQLMETAAEVGIGILLEFSDLVKVKSEPDYAAIDSLVAVYRDHPALLAWYIVDEPADFPVPPGLVAQIRQRIGRLDPYHPVYLVNNRPKTYEDYAEASDVLAVDVYPVPNYPIGRVRDYVQQAQWALEGGKPVWLVAQAFGGTEHWPRSPTPAELRNMVYQGVVSQVRGGTVLPLLQCRRTAPAAG